MKKIWSDKAWNDYLYWQTQDKKTLKRVNQLVKDIERNNFEGIGKPEALKILRYKLASHLKASGQNSPNPVVHDAIDNGSRYGFHDVVHFLVGNVAFDVKV